MFMEILYKQTTLFPLSSCRYKAVVTFFFFIARLKHLAVPLTPTPSGSVTGAAHPRTHRGIDTAVSKEPARAPSGSALDPQPLAIFQRRS